MIIGDNALGGLRSSLVLAFREVGWVVHTVDWGGWRPNVIGRAAFREPRLASWWRLQLRRRIDILAEVAPVDVVVVLKGHFLVASDIDYARSRLSSPIVCWNPDSPFDDAISNRGAGVPKAVGAYDLYITWAEDVAERLISVQSSVAVIPFAWDPVLHPVTTGRGEAAGRVVFVGTASRERTALIERIRKFQPVVYGNRWPAMEGVEVRPPLVGPDMAAVVGEARWNLNLLRPQNARSHNMRSFELPGAGGNQLTAKTPDHIRFLGADPRTVTYSSDRELLTLLGCDPDDLARRDPQLMAGHTYADRVRQLISTLSRLG